jgi:hypothetical protein
MNGFVKYFFYIIFIINVLYFVPDLGTEIKDFAFIFGGFNVYISDIIIIICIVLSIPLILRIKDEEVKENKVILYIALVYLVVQFFIILPLSMSEDIRQATLYRNFSKRLYFFQMFVFYFYLLRSIDVKQIFRLVDISVIILFIIAVYRLIIGQYGRTDSGQIRIFDGAASLLFGLGIFINILTGDIKIRNYVITIMSSAGLIFINHRSAYLAFILTFFLSFFVMRKKFKYAMTVFFSCTLVIFGTLMFSETLMDDFQTRFLQIADTNEGNAVDRLTRWDLGTEYFLQNWAIGSKLSGEMYLFDLDNPMMGKIDHNYSPHNFIVEIAVLEGTLGLVLFFAFLIPVIRIGFRNSFFDSITLRIFLYLIFYLCFNFFNAIYSSPYNILFLTLTFAIILNRNQVLHEETWEETEDEEDGEEKIENIEQVEYQYDSYLHPRP